MSNLFNIVGVGYGSGTFSWIRNSLKVGAEFGSEIDHSGVTPLPQVTCPVPAPWEVTPRVPHPHQPNTVQVPAPKPESINHMWHDQSIVQICSKIDNTSIVSMWFRQDKQSIIRISSEGNFLFLFINCSQLFQGANQSINPVLSTSCS